MVLAGTVIHGEYADPMEARSSSHRRRQLSWRLHLLSSYRHRWSAVLDSGGIQGGGAASFFDSTSRQFMGWPKGRPSLRGKVPT